MLDARCADGDRHPAEFKRRAVSQNQHAPFL
jgi:hypothetical protein